MSSEVSSRPISASVPRQPSVFANISWLMAGEAVGKGLGFLSTVYVARVLGSAGFGRYRCNGFSRVWHALSPISDWPPMGLVRLRENVRILPGASSMFRAQG